MRDRARPDLTAPALDHAPDAGPREPRPLIERIGLALVAVVGRPRISPWNHPRGSDVLSGGPETATTPRRAGLAPSPECPRPTVAQ